MIQGHNYDIGGLSVIYLMKMNFNEYNFTIFFIIPKL